MLRCFTQSRNYQNKDQWKNVAKATRRPMMAIVAFLSVPRTVFMELASRQTSASVNQDTGARYAITVSSKLYDLLNLYCLKLGCSK